MQMKSSKQIAQPAALLYAEGLRAELQTVCALLERVVAENKHLREELSSRASAETRPRKQPPPCIPALDNEAATTLESLNAQLEEMEAAAKMLVAEREQARTGELTSSG